MADETGAGVAPNAEQAAGEHRVRYAELFDAELRPYNERLRAAAAVGSGDRVLDIGCGTGESTRDAARAAVSGSAVGVDLSADVLERARLLAEREGLRNVTFRQADAQVERFPAEEFDLCLSRFGTMFFADPVAAFTNIGRALRPGARFVQIVWQGPDHNEWSSAVRRAILGDGEAVAVPAGSQHPFSLGDPAVAERVLAASGFAEIGFTDVHEPVYYGPDTDTAYDFVHGMRSPQELLAGLDAPAVESALHRLRAAVAEHDTGSGVFFDARAWIITARRVDR
jgi:SAM-dependent methyltransferase